MILIKNGRVVDAKSNTDEVLDVVIDGGEIKTIGKVEDDGSYDAEVLCQQDVLGVRLLAIFLTDLPGIAPSGS